MPRDRNRFPCFVQTRAAVLAASLVLLAGGSAQAATVTHGLATATAPAENSCLHSTLATNGDDCSYNASGTGASQWIGPTFSAGFYAPSLAPKVYDNPAVPSPVTAPARVLVDDVTNGIVMRGIPAGVTLTIDDAGTPNDPTDDVIGGSVAFSGFQRNFETTGGKRAIESFGYLQFFLTARKADSATANGAGGFDYVLGSAGVPALLSGTTTADGGFADAFPSAVASQSSASPLDVPYWTCITGSPLPLPACLGSIGIARFEGNVGASMAVGLTVGSDFKCEADPGVNNGACTSGATSWDSPNNATPKNVLLRVSTDATGAVTGGRMFLVKEFNATGDGTAPNDSWSATTIDFAGDALLHVVDDDVDFSKLPASGNAPPRSYAINALANDTFATTAADAVQSTSTPAHGTLSYANGRFSYTPASGTFPPDVFTYRITDAFGQTGSATVTVKGIVANGDGDTAATALVTVGGLAITVPAIANDAARTSTPVTLSIVTQPQGGSATVNADNTITYLPDASFSGCDASLVPSCPSASQPPATIRYRLADGEGRTAEANIYVNVFQGVLARNDGDTRATALTTVGGVSLTLTPTANDVFAPSTPVTVTILTPPRGGTATVKADNTITYTPDLLFEGCYAQLVPACRSFSSAADLIRYQVADAAGHKSEADIYVNVFPNPERKSGSSALDPLALALLGAARLLRRRRPVA